MILTVSNEFLLEYVLNNGVFVGAPQVITKGQMFTLLNLTNQAPAPVGAMQFTIQVNEGETFFMPTPESGTYNYNVNWGDSMQDNNVTEFDHSHLFAAGGVYTVWLTGICTEFAFDGIGSRLFIISVESLGNIAIEKLNFYSCGNLKSFTAGENANTSGIVSAIRLFNECFLLTHVDFGTMDFSNVIEYYYAFLNCYSLETLDHTALSMASATNIQEMFNGCTAMTTAAPEWWLIPEIITFEDCFLNNLLRSNYDDIPNDWKGIEP